MSYASDKLYDGYMRTNMARIVTKVKAREIIIHLPCLTDHDIESIETKNDFSGSYEAMKLLLSCMKRRENWPEQFISALENCGQRTIAAEIRAEYDQLRGINNASPPPPAPPAGNVVRAHVHPAPSVPHLPDPVSAASALPTRDVPSEARETSPIQESETVTKSTLVLSAAPEVQVTTPPEPPQVQVEPQTQAAVVPPATPPPSPESSNRSPPPEQVDLPRQEPEENLEPDEVQVQDVPNETVQSPQETEENPDDSTLVDLPTPDTTTIEDTINKPLLTEPEPFTASEEDPAPSAVTEDELTTTSLDSSVASSVEVSPARSLSPMTNLDDSNLTPVKAPVQETSPKEETVPSVVPVQEDTLEPQNTQMLETVQATRVPSAEAENGDRGSKDEDICFSKPGVLMSSEPPDQNDSTLYSGDSTRLEMSKEASSQENGLSHKQQDEDASESPASSSDEEDVEESIGHVAEEPSILNKEIEVSQPAEEISAVPLVPEATLISDLSSCSNSGALPENLIHNKENEEQATSPMASLDMEDVREEPSILNKEIQASQPAEKNPAVSLVPEATLISDLSSCTNAGALPENLIQIEENEEQVLSCPTESLTASLDMEDVHEEPSILNQETQASQPGEEIPTVLLVPEATLISDPSCCTNAGALPDNLIQIEDKVKQATSCPTESLMASLDMEDVREEPSILNKEIEASFIENIVQPAVEIVVPEPTLISDQSFCTKNGDLPGDLHHEEEHPSLLHQTNTEDHATTESPAPSLDTEDVRENVGRVAEEPWILNLEVQEPAAAIADAASSEHAQETSNQETPIVQINGEPSKETTPLLPQPAPATNGDNQPNDPPVDQKLGGLGSGTSGGLNRRHVLAAAGVGACALLIAWRFKH